MKKLTFEQIYKWFVLMLLPATALFFLFHQYERPKVKSKSDLVYAEGRIEEYSFQYKSGRSTSMEFYIWIEGYDCKFQIIADYSPYFEKSRFENTMKIGDSIKIAIPKEDKDKFFKNERVIAMSIDGNKSNYMSHIDTIAEENKFFDIYAAIAFFILGGILFILEKKGILKIR